MIGVWHIPRDSARTTEREAGEQMVSTQNNLSIGVSKD